MPNDAVRGVFNGHVVWVGEDSPAETFNTPFGKMLGVQIHAAAALDLVTGRWIRRTPWWSSVLIIVVVCYLLAALADSGASARRMLAVALGATLFMFLAAAVAMQFWLVWLDVIYPVVAVWGLLILLLSLRRRLARDSATSAGTPGKVIAK